MKFSDAMLNALRELKTAYALVDMAGRILEHDGRFPLWVAGEEGSLVGRALADVFPEIVGQEEVLESVRRGESLSWRLEYLHRTMPDGKDRYLALTVVPGRPEAGIGLMVLVTDITEQGTYLQQLTQSRNEILLLRERLQELQSQLESLLRQHLPPSRRR